MRRSLVVVTFALFAAACGDNDNNNNGPVVDAGSDAGAGGAVEMVCATLPASTNTCDVTSGGTTTLIKGNVLTSTVIYKGGQVAIDPAGKISCVGCNCATGGETTLSCPDAVISPGLINTHDHITYAHNDPYLPTGEHATDRYDDRQQWREGNGGRYQIPYKAARDILPVQTQWGELRMVMGGATSIVGGGGEPGLLRNLDSTGAEREGLAHKAVDFDTFPLDDADGKQRTADCNYGSRATTEAAIAALEAYEPHTSEGINTEAHNEFLCQSSTTYDSMAPGVSHNLLVGKTAMIHAIGLNPADYGAMAVAGTGLIWSPRSNITLYGETARITTAAKLGVEIALGTDWMPSGSMNLLRELACADSFNKTYLDRYFSDQQLWEMVTINAAALTATDASIGSLVSGKTADIAIFASHGKPYFRSVIEAEPKDVGLVMRGGKILYGDDAVVSQLAQTCDTVDVCGVAKRVCAMAEVGKTYDGFKAASNNIYPAFACGVPQNEPSCTPTRPISVAGSTIYTGMTSAADSDGDGIADATDNCPRVFNPVRPMDNGVQGNADSDAEGDACDPCPLDAGTTQCMVVDTSDRDQDGVTNATDNCPDVANADQKDVDQDSKGDVCDVCPADANPGSSGCPKTIYQIKTGMAPLGLNARVTNGLVTGRGSNGYFVQVKETDAGYLGPANSGLFVFTGSAPAAAIVAGTRVTVDGTITNFQGQIELTTPVTTVTDAVTVALPAPTPATYADVKTGGPLAAALESVIVSLGTANVTAVDATLVEFTLTDGAASSLVVDDFVFALPAPPVDQVVNAVTGILALRQIASGMPSISKLLPGSAADLTLGPPGLKALTPALSFARAGITTAAPTFPVPLTVTLTGPAQGATTVTLVSGDPASLTVTDVVIADGAISAAVPVTAIAQAAEITITATLAGKSSTARVRVLGAAEEAATVTLSPPGSTIAANGTVQLTATLDLPALAATPIVLSVAPLTAGTLPATVDIAPGATSVTFAYTDTSAATATITATYVPTTGPTSTSVATVTIGAATGHLVINEVDYDQVINPDSAEFIEIYNPTSSSLSLVGKALVLVNGNGSAPYGTPVTLDLSTATVNGAPLTALPSHGFLVVAGATFVATLPANVPRVQTAWVTDAVQNGAPDGIALIDTTSHTLVDVLSYEGAITAVMLPGFMAAVSLVEGTALPAATADTGNGSLCRKLDGEDTDDAAADWKVCATSSAGATNP
ncbi:MAG: lamin tail domain-containing protein [Myxococcales bacterium]|nr:lamin tail domain-containing protein [Myxococcales bacterium]